MKLNRFNIVFVTLTVLLAYVDATAYSCYNCTNCGDPFDSTLYNSSLVSCSSGCFKTKTNIPGQSTAVVRGCTTLSNCTQYDYGALSWGVYNYCCYKGSCNSSSFIFSMPALIFGLLLLTFFSWI